MSYSITGFAYFGTFLSAGFLTYRFFQYWRKERTLTAKLFFYFMAIFSLFFLTTFIPAFFFAQNTFLLKGVVIITAFLESLACGFLGYLIFYLKVPRLSPWIGFFIPLVLGISATVLSIITPFEVYLEPGGAINWGDRGLADYLRNLVYFTTFLPMTFILFEQFKKSGSPYGRSRALGLGLVFVFVIVITLFDYGVEKIFNFPAVSSDIFQGILSIFLFVFLVLTQKTSTAEKNDLPRGYVRSMLK